METEISIKNIFRLSTPAAISFATIMLVGIIDLLFIGQLGTIAIAAAAPGIAICTAIYGFLDGIRISTSVITSRFLGAKDDNGIKKILNVSLFSSIILGLLTLPFIGYLTNFIFNFIDNAAIFDQGTSYLYIRLFSITFVLITSSVIGIFRGLHNTSVQLAITTVICAFNIILDYGLIYGKLGFPQLGVKGAAIATLIAEIAGAIAAVLILFVHKLTKNKISFFLPSYLFYKKYQNITIESGLYSGLPILALNAFVLIFGKLGSQTLAAYQICSQIFLITVLPQAGFFVAISIIVGKLIGAKQYKLFIPITIRTSTLSALTAILTSILILMFPYQIISIFSPKDATVINYVSSILIFICLDQIMSSVNLVLKGALSGIEDTRFISIITFLTGYLFFLPATYLLGISMQLGLIGGYIALMVWEGTTAIILCTRIFIKQKHLNKITLSQTQPMLPTPDYTFTNTSVEQLPL